MKSLSLDGIITANLTVILAVIVLLNFAEREVGKVVQDWEEGWLRWSYVLILVVFSLSATSLFFACSASIARKEAIENTLIRFSTFTIFAEFFILFVLLSRFTIARIYGIG